MVELLGCYDGGHNDLCIVMELMQGGKLTDVINAWGVFPEDMIAYLSKEIVTGACGYFWTPFWMSPVPHCRLSPRTGDIWGRVTSRDGRHLGTGNI